MFSKCYFHLVAISEIAPEDLESSVVFWQLPIESVLPPPFKGPSSQSFPSLTLLSPPLLHGRELIEHGRSHACMHHVKCKILLMHQV